MASHRAFLGWILFFGVVGLGLHLAGFSFPGWIVLKTHGEKFTMRQMVLGWKDQMKIDDGPMMDDGRGQKIDDGGVRPPMMDENNMWDDILKDPRPMGPRPHHKDHDGMGHDGMHEDKDHLLGRDGHGRPPPTVEESDSSLEKEMEMDGRRHHKEEMLEINEFLSITTTGVQDFEVSVHYGLWYSKMCVHMKKPKEEFTEEDDIIEAEEVPEDGRIIDKRDADSSSSSSSDEDHHGKHGKHHRGKCHCKKLSTRCALKMAVLFESPFVKPERRLSESNMGRASLREHQAEATTGLILLVLGILGAIASFRKPNGCRCVKIVTAIFLLVATVLIAVPVIRLTCYNYYRKSLHDGVDVHFPYATVFCSSACAMIFSAAVAAFVGIIAQGRKERAGRWYQFNNEYSEQEEKAKKGPALVFYNDPYPVKAGVTDVCDFSDINLTEEPEKKPLE